jgi:predicted outer membrane repeat protein
VCALLCAAVASSAPAGVVYVDQSAAPGGNGLSWATARRDLQDALAQAASSGGALNEVWIAEGVYRPDRGTNNRAEAFTLFSGVTVRGGFLGDETTLSQRPAAGSAPTILTGEIGSSTDAADNSFHVLLMTSRLAPFTLDRVVVRGGRADGAAYPNNSGGGLCSEGSGTVIDCVFEGNHAVSGGGAFGRFGTTNLVNCVFRSNTASSEGGGAWVRDGGEVRDSEFSGNNAGFGGGLWTCCGPIRVIGCSFTSNFGNYGGGIFNSSGGLLVQRCEFVDNSASRGGAAHMGTNSWLVNCFLGGNSGDRGGAVYVNGASTAVNCVFARNFALSSGGAAWAAASFTAASCTVHSNSALLYGGGIYAELGSAVVTNSILWSNSDSTGQTQGAQFTRVGGTNPVLSHCCVQGWNGTVAGIAIMSAPPRFLDPLGTDGKPGTTDDNLRLASGSPGIDAGDATLLPLDQTDVDADSNTSEPTPVDLDGLPRTAASRAAALDLGAYEFAPPPEVPGDATGDGLINFGDVTEVLMFWGMPSVAADIDGSGLVDFGDITEVLTFWGL